MAAVESEVATQTESSDRELSLRETLEAARDEVMSRQEEPETPEPEPKPQVDESRPRDERGRFVSGVEKTETPPAAAESLLSPTPPKEDVAPATAAPSVQDFVAAPNSWTNQEKALWKDVSPAVRAAISRREADIHKELTRRNDDLSFAREFQRISQPYEPVLRQLGASPLQAVQSLMQSLWTLTTADPVTRGQFIQSLAQRYGAQIPAGSNQGQPQPQLPPQLQQYFAQQSQVIQQLQSQQQALIQQQENAQNAQINAELQAFQSDPANKFFPHVKDDMAHLLEKGVAETLKEAYDLAVYRRPDLRNLVTAPAQAPQRQVRTQNARAKAGSVRGGPGVSADVPFKSDGSVRGDLQAAFREVAGRE